MNAVSTGRFTMWSLAIATLLLVQAAEAQSYRTISSSRSVRGEDQLWVHVSFSAGRVDIRPDAGALYRASLVYDQDKFQSTLDYDRSGQRLTIDVDPDGGLELKNRSRSRQRLDLGLSPGVPTVLDLELGASESEIELGGLNLRSVVLKTGASSTNINFSKPTTGECRELSFHVGAAGFTARGLGNSRCRRLVLEAGAGDFTLDFTGDWDESTEMASEITIGLASLTLEVPSDVGVSVQVDSKFLASFDKSGFTRSGNTYYSENYDTVSNKLSVRLTAVLGDLNFVWMK